jgi:flavin-dependent dehydrogenase
VLDEALLARAAVAGARICRATAVHSLRQHQGRWEAQFDVGGAVSAPIAFLATGKHDLRGWKRPPGIQSDLLGLKMHWRLTPAASEGLGHGVELVLFPDGYAGLEPVEGGYANLCLLVRRRRFAEVGRSWEALLHFICAASPLLESRLTGATPRWSRPLAVSGIPFGHMKGGDDGPWRIGDQAAVIPSFRATASLWRFTAPAWQPTSASQGDPPPTTGKPWRATCQLWRTLGPSPRGSPFTPPRRPYSGGCRTTTAGLGCLRKG